MFSFSLACNKAFWSRLYGLNFISVSAERCLLDRPVCYSSAASVASVKWETEEEGKWKKQMEEEEAEPVQYHKWMNWSSRTGIGKTGKVVFVLGVPRWSLMFSTAGRVFLRGVTDTADIISLFWLSSEWGLPHWPSEPWLGFGGRGGGAQEDSELEGVKALWFLSNVRGIW